jgi:hypothetical protein
MQRVTEDQPIGSEERRRRGKRRTSSMGPRDGKFFFVQGRMNTMERTRATPETVRDAVQWIQISKS